jgi:hypothetical protein
LTQPKVSLWEPYEKLAIRADIRRKRYWRSIAVWRKRYRHQLAPGASALIVALLPPVDITLQDGHGVLVAIADFGLQRSRAQDARSLWRL